MDVDHAERQSASALPTWLEVEKATGKRVHSTRSWPSAKTPSLQPPVEAMPAPTRVVAAALGDGGDDVPLCDYHLAMNLEPNTPLERIRFRLATYAVLCCLTKAP